MSNDQRVTSTRSESITAREAMSRMRVGVNPLSTDYSTPSAKIDNESGSRTDSFVRICDFLVSATDRRSESSTHLADSVTTEISVVSLRGYASRDDELGQHPHCIDKIIVSISLQVEQRRGRTNQEDWFRKPDRSEA